MRYLPSLLADNFSISSNPEIPREASCEILSQKQQRHFIHHIYYHFTPESPFDDDMKFFLFLLATLPVMFNSLVVSFTTRTFNKSTTTTATQKTTIMMNTNDLVASLVTSSVVLCQQEAPELLFWQQATLEALRGGVIPLSAVLAIFTLFMNLTKMELKTDMTTLKSDIDMTKVELKSDIHMFKVELKSEINMFKVELKSEINNLSMKIDNLINTVASRLDNQDDSIRNFKTEIDLKIANFTATK